ncbi:MAG: chorismate mutase [Polyangiales bacterium]
MDRELEALRAAVDEADEALVRALALRWRAVQAIAEHKQRRGLEGFDPTREGLLRERWRALAAHEGVDGALVDAVFDAVIARCRAKVEGSTR